MKLKLVFLIVCLSLTYHSLFSQSSISGKVLDNETKTPIEFAAVYVRNVADTTYFSTAQTNETGVFILKNLRAGKYNMMIRSVGYTPFRNSILVETQKNTSVPDIFLKPSSIALRDVEVSAVKPFIQMQGDKQVYNVEQNTVNAGGTAQEVLQRLPSVTVDMDGNISLRGNSSVQIWMDGKPIGGSTTVAQLLQQIPASSISKIEMVTNPSARYDAEGTGGIINIVTKNIEGRSYGGYVEGSWLIPNKANAAAGIQFKKNKWTFQANYSYRYDPRYRYGNSFRTSTFNNQFFDTKYYTGQQSVRQNHGIRIGIDYLASSTSKWSINFSITPNRNDEDEVQYTVQKTSDSDTSLFYSRVIQNTNDNLFGNGTLAWRKNISKKTTLNTDFQYSGSFKKEQNIYNSKIPIGDVNISPLEKTIQNGSEQNFIYNLDLSFDLKKNERIELGFRNTVKLLNGTNNYDIYAFDKSMFEIDTTRSSIYTYNQIVPAAYLTYKNSFKKLSYGFGLRAEYTYLIGSEKYRNIDVSQQFFNLFPSGNLSYALPKNQQITASYSLRINRPNIRQLLPVGDFSDVQNIRIGNIDLKPEIIHSAEIGYNISFLQQYFSASAYYKHILNSITWKKTFLDEQVSVNSFVNADATKNAGLELILHNQFFKIWEITSSYNASFITLTQTDNTSKITNSGWRHTLKVLSSVTFWKGTSVQVGYDYNSPNITLQGQFGGFMTLDAGIKKDFLQKTLSVSFNANDILNTRQFTGFASGSTFEQNLLRKRESRTYTLSLSYRFGTQERKNKKDRNALDSGGDMNMDF